MERLMTSVDKLVRFKEPRKKIQEAKREPCENFFDRLGKGKTLGPTGLLTTCQISTFSQKECGNKIK